MGSYGKLVTILFLLIRTIPPIYGKGQVHRDDVITITNIGENSVDDDVQNSTASTINGTSTKEGEVSSIEMPGNINVTSTSAYPTISAHLETLQLPTNSSEIHSPSLADSEEVEEPLPLPPQKLQQSPLSSLLLAGGSSESLQQFLKTQGFSFAPGDPSPDPVELNKLLSRFKPKQGRFDPMLLDIINNNGGGGFLPNLNFFGTTPSKEDVKMKPIRDNYWSPSLPPSSKPPRGHRNRFSSKFNKHYRDNETILTTTTPPPPQTAPRPEQQIPSSSPSASLQPFSYITDPNLRNHRLYDWKLEKNFTSIDQIEDLLADSSEISSVAVVKAPLPTPSSTPGWIPKAVPQPRPKHYNNFPSTRPISMEGTQFDSSGDLFSGDNSIPPNTFVPFPSDSAAILDSEGVDEGVTEPFNLLRPKPPKRPREPLRESSTENLIIDKRRDDKYKLDEMVRSQEQDGRRKLFRPSPTDEVGFSPPVFVDPDQDFFTSTIRNYNKHEDDEKNAIPSFIRPMRRLPKGKRIKDKDGRHDKRVGDGYQKRKRKPVSEEAITDLERDPRPYPEDDRDRDHRDRLTSPNANVAGSNERDQEDMSPYINSNPTRKSDRILVHPGELNVNSQSEVRPAYYNFYPVREFGPASNEHEQHYDQQQQHNYPEESYPEEGQENHDRYAEYPEHYNYNPSKSGVVIGHNGEPIYAGGYDDKFHHPFAGSDNQPEYSSYSTNSNEGWSNTYWILGGLIALSALTAFIIPTLLHTMGRNGKIRNDLQDENIEYDDQTSPASSSSSSSTITSALFGGKKPPSNTGDDNDDPTADSDLWSEIKGVYNDVVKIVRGDYGGIVDKLSGFKDKDKDNDKFGPNIVYRDDDVISNDAGDRDVLDDDFDYETKQNQKNKFGTRKGKAKPKKPNRTISSSINYVVSNSSPGTVVVSSKNGGEQETSRGVPLVNDTMATFYLGPSSSSRPFYLLTSPAQSSSASSTSGDGFMGEWAKVQLIGS